MKKSKRTKFCIVAGLGALVLSACAESNSDSTRLAADSCAFDPFTPVSSENLFRAGPGEVFFSDPQIGGDWSRRARQRAQLAASAAAADPYWQPLADSWGIAEAAARAAALPEIAASATDLKLSYAMVTKDVYCRMAIVRTGFKLSKSL